MARRLEEEVREGGGKAKKRGERWEGERERELACLFCMLITDVGKARSRFCWEAFIAHEKAGCLLKKKTISRMEGKGESHRGPTGQGTALALELQGGKDKRDWNLSSPECHSHWVGKGFCISRLLHPWRPQTASLGRCLCGCLSLPLLSCVLFWHLYRSFWRWLRVPGPSGCLFGPEPHSFHAIPGKSWLTTSPLFHILCCWRQSRGTTAHARLGFGH